MLIGAPVSSCAVVDQRCLPQVVVADDVREGNTKRPPANERHQQQNQQKANTNKRVWNELRAIMCFLCWVDLVGRDDVWLPATKSFQKKKKRAKKAQASKARRRHANNSKKAERSLVTASGAWLGSRSSKPTKSERVGFCDVHVAFGLGPQARNRKRKKKERSKTERKRGTKRTKRTKKACALIVTLCFACLREPLTLFAQKNATFSSGIQ